MEFSLLENGLDSLKKSKNALENFEKFHEATAYHFLKDSIIFFHHSMEILFKYVLSSKSEVLIFKDIKSYLEAKKQLYNERKKFEGLKPGEGFGQNRNTLYNVFDVEKGDKLNTINLLEALERLEFLCDIPLEEDFKGTVEFVNGYRNKLMHHSLLLEQSDINTLLQRMKFSFQKALLFFEEFIPGITEQIDQEFFVLTREEYEEHQRDMEAYYHERAMSDITLDDLEG